MVIEPGDFNVEGGVEGFSVAQGRDVTFGGVVLEQF